MRVRITQYRQGNGFSYKVGEVVTLSDAKARQAIANRWAVAVEETHTSKARETATVKHAETRSSEPVKLDTIDAVMKHFSGNAKAMKAYASEKGIEIPGRSKKATTIAKYIAEA